MVSMIPMSDIVRQIEAVGTGGGWSREGVVMSRVAYCHLWNLLATRWCG